MADRQWTPMQRAAIECTDKTLLVSAAAGSGKTATLTERIIRQIMNEREPMSVSDMLVVTFTRAAAGELRDRIAAALKDALSRDPENQWLNRQLMLLPSARISTIDSFCSDILRANCERVGVPHGYRIADGAEAELLADGILDGLLDTLYEGRLPEVATAEEVDELCRCLTDSGAQSDLAAVLRVVYKRSLDTEEGVALFSRLVSEFDPARYSGAEAGRFGSYCMARVGELTAHYTPIVAEYLEELRAVGNDKLGKRIAVLEGDLAFLSRLAAAEGIDGVRLVLEGSDLPSTPTAGSGLCALPIAELRRTMKKDISDLFKKFFFQPASLWEHTYSELHRVLSVLCRILECFHSAFRGEKLRRGVLQYSDVTRLTYECLWQDGAPTEVARSQAEQYSAVYVDEYQDVNTVQHRIFEAISRPDNRFMVGDIKQSIYCFRSADPTVFAEMKGSFPDLSSAAGSPSASIFMSDNFRCDPAIIDFVNSIFDKIFPLISESIGYKPEDRLNAAKKYEGQAPEYIKPKVCLVPRGKRTVTVDGEERKTHLAALTVAEKIRELLATGRLNNGEPVRPEHIAVIMRNAKGHDAAYATAIASLGIPVSCATHGGFFLSPEILLTMCVLYSIDNPTRDVYLAGALASPLGGFSADELTLVRRAGGSSLYASLLAYNRAHPEFVKGAEFVKRLERYRLISEGVTVDALIAMLYRETDLLSLGSAGGSRDNMMRLYEHARRFEKSSYKGLYNFLNYASGVIDRKNEFDETEAILDGSSVKIITAHGSKGLEFPVVFFVDAEVPLHSRFDTEARLLLQEKFGMGMKLRTEGGLGLVDNPTRHVVADVIERRKLEEEARVLYVVLTRAREQLYVIATKSGGARYAESIESGRQWLDGYSVYSLSSYLDMIALTACPELIAPDELLDEPPEYLTGEALAELGGREAEDEEDEEPTPTVPVSGNGEGGEVCEKERARLAGVLAARFAYEYPDKPLTELPEKLSVSRLYPAVLDASDEDAYHMFDPEREGAGNGRLILPRTGVLPDFYSGIKRNDATARGIATHLLLQFCDLSRLMTEGGESELRRLVSEKFISERDAELVRLEEVELFRRSRLLRDMMSARRIWRELRFNVRLPAEVFSTEVARREALKGREVLVQGIIDCLIEDSEGGLHLVDYKTDRLTAAELSDRQLAEKKLREAHSLQLSYYSLAIERMFSRRPLTTEVYSLPLGDTVNVGEK